jgi:LPXTG-motif cell wall-anchored protein
MRKRLLLVIGVLTGFVVGAAPASAQQYPPGAFFLTLSDTTVVPGQTISFTGAVSPDATTVTLTFFSVAQSLGSATPDDDGNISGSVTIPTDATLGTHTITAADDTGLEVSATVEVVSAQAAAGAGAGAAGAAAGQAGAAGGLPITGDDSVPMLRAGGALLALGCLLVFLTRRREPASEKPTASV